MDVSMDVAAILDRLKAGKHGSFRGGVNPPGQKSLSNTAPIGRVSLADEINIPVRQHIGAQGSLCVEVGQQVLKGQALTNSSHPFAVPVHASTSGEIIAIGPHVTAHPSGLPEICVTIRPDGEDTWGDLIPLPHYQDLPLPKVVEAICDAGITGMGGAGFPTHIKTNSSKPIEFLIINGAECEPYITADDRLMREYAWQIRQGIDVLQHLIKPSAVLIAIEDNKPEAIEAMKIACQDKAAYHVIAIETKYPAGGEKQLIEVLTGREVPRDGLPADLGILMFNVGTCYAVADAIMHGKPLVERVITMTGEAIEAPGNVWAPIGTPVAHLLKQTGYNGKKQYSPKVIMGGPMMGFTLNDAAVPVVKTTNCLLVPGKNELPEGDEERPCIRCSACADVCPVTLLPQQIFWYAKAREYDKAQEYNLFDCIECGACAYVCPSEIPLVHYYRQAKAEIRLQRDERSRAEKAKERFEARKARLEKEKHEREEKHRRAKEARLAAAQTSSETSDGDSKDKVAAALARAKAKKAASQPQAEFTTDDSPTLENSQQKVAAAIARAKAKKAAQSNEPEAGVQAHNEEDKKAKVAAAIARAKAKKSAQNQTAPTGSADNNASSTQAQEDEGDDKKRRIAAAVAKAKTKKAQQAEKTTASPPDDESSSVAPQENEDDEKKRRIAAAVAKAKAKKAQQAEDKPASPPDESSSVAPQENEDDEKKRRIAAAVAKAKARKLNQQQNNEN